MSTRSFALFAGALLTVLAPARAQTIASYTFENTRAAAVVSANASATAAVYGPGVAGVGFGAGNGGGFSTVAAGYNAGNFGKSTRSDYLEIAVTAASGYSLNPTTLTFDVQATANGPSQIAVRSSIDAFGTTIGTEATPSTTAFTTVTVPLLATTYGNRPILRFRIYGYGTGTKAAGTLRIDNVVLSGAVQIPATEVPTLAFDPLSLSTTEGGTATATVRLGIINDTGTAGLNAVSSATVTFSVDASTAVAADVSFTGTVSFPAGTAAGATRTVSIATVDDTVFEGTEQAAFFFDAVSTGTSASGQLTLTIPDNDAPTLFVNEIDPQSAAAGDAAEFVEITGPAGTSLSGFVLVFFDASTNASYLTTDLSARTLDASGRLVVGNPDVVGAGLTFPAATLRDGSGAVALYQDAAATFPDETQATSVNLVSTIVYGAATLVDQSLLNLLGVFVQYAESYEGSAASFSLGRLPLAGGPSRLVYAQVPSPNAANAATVVVDRTADVARGNGYRMFSAPVVKPDGALRFNVHDLAQINLVQRVAAGSDAGGSYGPQYPTAQGPNLYLGYTGAGYTAAATTADDLVPGAGFFWRFYDADIVPTPTGPFGPGTSRSYALNNPAFRLRLTGTPVENGALNVPHEVPFVQNTSGFYLIGNPFAYPLQLDGIAPSTGTFQTTFQVFDGVSYQPVTAGTSVVAPWQGLFAESATLTAASGAFTVRYDSRRVLPQSRTTDLIGRPGGEEALAGVVLHLDGTTASGAAVADRAAAVRLRPDAAPGWDTHDASKLVPPVATYALVALVGDRGGEPYRHSVLALPGGGERERIVPVGFTATDAGTYTLTADLAGLPAGWTAELRDAVTGAVADLTDGYTFASEATDWTDRFALALRAGSATASEPTPTTEHALSAPAPNPSSGRSSLTLRLSTAEHVTATVIDALGRTVVTLFDGEAPAGTDVTLVVEGSRLATGIYVVRVQGATFMESRRVVVVR